LLNKGANINAKVGDNNARYGGFTPLHLAAMCGITEAFKTLLNNGADKNIKNSRGETAYDIAQAKKLDGAFLALLRSTPIPQDKYLAQTIFKIQLVKKIDNTLKFNADNFSSLTEESIKKTGISNSIREVFGNNAKFNKKWLSSQSNPIAEIASSPNLAEPYFIYSFLIYRFRQNPDQQLKTVLLANLNNAILVKNKNLKQAIIKALAKCINEYIKSLE
jgi:ankyrin repeat protein